MSAAKRPRTYSRNPPLKRTRTEASSPPPIARGSPLPYAIASSSKEIFSPNPAHLAASSSLPPPPSSPGPSSSSDPTLTASVALPSNASSTSKGKARAKDVKDPKQGTLKGFFTLGPPKPKARISPDLARWPSPQLGTSSSGPSRLPPPPPKTGLQQLLLVPLQHLSTCQTCLMTYSPHSPPDVRAHDVFHSGIERGVVWFDGDVEGAEQVGEEVKWECGEGSKRRRGRGRFVRVDGVPGGKLGRKIKEIHHLLNTHLSAPALPPTVLARTQTYLLLSSSAPSKKPRASTSASGEGKEYVIGACVVQRIQTGMRVLSAQEVEQRKEDGERLVVVDEQTADEHDGGVFCDPTPIPTLLGVHRVHLSTSFRQLNLASSLLDVVCRTAIYGHPIVLSDDDQPGVEGGVAFSQPTRSGRALMQRWGKGKVKVFVEDEE